MKFCSHCGSEKLEDRVPEGDHRPRIVCQNCNTVHYINPNLVVGCLIVLNDKVLLAKRGIEPRLGYWNLPCGFLENGESVEDGALREVEEETGMKVEIDHLHAIYSLTKSNQVYMIFQVKAISAEFETTEESTEIQFFRFNEIPWEEIAFSSNTFALQKFLEKHDKENQEVFIGQYRK